MRTMTFNALTRRWLAMAMLAIAFATPLAALAQPTPAPGGGTPAPVAPAGATADDTCTDIAAAKEEAFNGTDGKGGLLSEIYNFIKEVVGEATERLFRAFTDSDAYQAAVGGAMTLMVVIFAVGFTIGVIQVSFQQVLTRLVKLGLIAAVISPAGWIFFSDYAVTFFMDGTDDLVKGIIQIGTGTTTPLPADATPFYQLDKLAEFLIQPDTIIAIMGATFAGGPYGMMMGALMAIASWGFVTMLIKALRIYAVTFVARSLLLGVAPIFIVFLLFDRTKQMFSSWLNALISMSLQPILLFTFLSFFMVLLESSAKDMFSAELCWTEFTSSRGTANPLSFWRFKDENGLLHTSEMTWEGSIQCLIEGKTKTGGECPEFPINIIDILSFLILVYLAQRFADVIDRMANELSNTFISLDAGGKIDQFVQQATNAATGQGRARR